MVRYNQNGGELICIAGRQQGAVRIRKISENDGLFCVDRRITPPLDHNIIWLSLFSIPRWLRLVLSPPWCLLRRSHSLVAPSMGSSPSVIARASDTPASEIDDVAALGNVQVLAVSTGMPVFIKDLWDQEQGIAVVALLRHFGCICCWELASELKELIPRLEAAGVKLIAVGVGSPENARILAERLPFPSDYLYADPDRKAYNVLGLYYGLRRTFFSRAIAKVFLRFGSLQKVRQNYTISATPDDKSSVLQQGGMLIFKGKDLLYARKDEGTGDHAPMNEVLDICCKVPVA